MELRIGNGYDIHRLEPGRKLILGGVEIPFKKGLVGHSDADCLCHAITDALLGALALPDIGQFFPDTDPKTAGIDSTQMLRTIYEREILSRFFRVINVDSTIIAQEPHLASHLVGMRCALGGILGVAGDRIGIKATTSEGLGATGKRKAIACFATCLLEKFK
ncbi:MAG: 2-C-methyl-D-erythritol 2,4-cyclodiphosphate synthase [Puniceicoccales bacterium]|nr:2-C-methyl-D-erythritol 2,4-cyclodiphosphate synthase [Puniceicoccales bacterium]